MLVTRNLKLLSTLLAAKHSGLKDDSPSRVFARIKTPKDEDPKRVYLSTPMQRWNWAFLEARDALKLGDVATSAIIPCHWYSAKRISAYNRKFRQGLKGPMVTVKHESIPGGQSFEMRFTLSRHIPPGLDGQGRFTRPPEEAEFDAMLEHIGEHLGMSEWGQHYLFGRFEIKKPYVEPEGEMQAPKL